MVNKELEQDGAAVVALTADLMFAARIRGSAPEAAAVQRLDALTSRLGPATRLVLVDMQAGEAVAAIREVRDRGLAARVVAFAPHVDEAALSAAREAGADDVMVRGAFVRQLPDLLQ